MTIKTKTMTTTTNDNLTGKVALVTGGAKRVGAAIALKLARAGMDVAITFRTSSDEARQTVESIERIGRRAHAFRVDMAEPDVDQQLYEAMSHHFDRLDALINNASQFEPTTDGPLDATAIDEQFAVNARAPMLLIRRFADMLAAHYDKRDPTMLGRVINFIDIHVLGEPLAHFLAYNASKAALYEATKTFAMELAPKITVNALAPGVVDWPPDFTDAMKREYLKRVPLARAGTPEDAATAALFLIRDAHYTTGQVIRLDGGRLLT
jgi:pteridine reductase